jgi:hypothetical protein
MFLSVHTNDGPIAAINTDLVTHMTVAAFAGKGCKIYFTSKDGLSVRDTMEELLARMNAPAE